MCTYKWRKNEPIRGKTFDLRDLIEVAGPEGTKIVIRGPKSIIVKEN